MSIRRIKFIFMTPWPVVRTALLVAALAVLAAVACSGDDPEPTATAVPPPVQSSSGAGNTLQLPNIADTVERVRPSVVAIVAEVITQDSFGRRRSGFGSGTGVIFDPSGLVLTNNHVIEGGVEITVTLDDSTQMVADVVGADRLSDLAVLRLPEDEYRYLPVQDTGGLRAGDWVIAIGNALALPGGPRSRWAWSRRWADPSKHRLGSPFTTLSRLIPPSTLETAAVH